MRYLVYRPRQAVNGGTPERPAFLVQAGPVTLRPYTKTNLTLAMQESWGQVEIENDEEEGRD